MKNEKFKTNEVGAMLLELREVGKKYGVGPDDIDCYTKGVLRMGTNEEVSTITVVEINFGNHFHNE